MRSALRPLRAGARLRAVAQQLSGRRPQPCAPSLLCRSSKAMRTSRTATPRNERNDKITATAGAHRAQEPTTQMPACLRHHCFAITCGHMHTCPGLSAAPWRAARGSPTARPPFAPSLAAAYRSECHLHCSFTLNKAVAAAHFSFVLMRAPHRYCYPHSWIPPRFLPSFHCICTALPTTKP